MRRGAVPAWLLALLALSGCLAADPPRGAADPNDATDEGHTEDAQGKGDEGAALMARLAGTSCKAAAVGFAGVTAAAAGGRVIAAVGRNWTALWDTQATQALRCEPPPGSLAWSDVAWNGTDFLFERLVDPGRPPRAIPCGGNAPPGCHMDDFGSPPHHDHWRLRNGSLQPVGRPLEWPRQAWPFPPGAAAYQAVPVGELTRPAVAGRVAWPMCGVDSLFLHDGTLYGRPIPDLSCPEAARWWRFDGWTWVVSHEPASTPPATAVTATADGKAFFLDSDVEPFTPPSTWHSLDLLPPQPQAIHLGDRHIRFWVAEETSPWGTLNVTWKWQLTEKYGWSVVFEDETALDVTVTITDPALGIVRSAVVKHGDIPRPPPS